MTSPKLVIMDEPTSGLDPLIQQAFYEILQEESKERYYNILSSHVLSEVPKIMRQSSNLKEGKRRGSNLSKNYVRGGYKRVVVTFQTLNPKGYLNPMDCRL